MAVKDFLDITSERPKGENPFLLEDSEFGIELTPRDGGGRGLGLGRSPGRSEEDFGEKDYKTPRLCFGSITPIKTSQKDEETINGTRPNSVENEKKGLHSMLEELTVAGSEPIYGGGRFMEKTSYKRHDPIT
jgi:hypothetical protein